MKSRELSFAIRAICDGNKSVYDENISFLRNTLTIEDMERIFERAEMEGIEDVQALHDERVLYRHE